MATNYVNLKEPGFNKKKEPWKTYVHSHPCSEPTVFIVSLKNKDHTPAFFKPIKEGIDNDPDYMLQKLGVIGYVVLRDQTDHNANEALTHNNYPVKGLLYAVDPNVSEDEAKNEIANDLAAFANSDPQFIGTHNQYEVQDVEEEKLPVNYIIRDRDTLKLLKKIYGRKGVKKSDIEEDTDLLIRFFGSVKEGHHYLSILTDTQWEFLDS